MLEWNQLPVVQPTWSETEIRRAIRNVYQKVRRGEILAYRIGGVLRIREDDLNAYVRESKIQKPPSRRRVVRKATRNLKEI